MLESLYELRKALNSKENQLKRKDFPLKIFGRILKLFFPYSKINGAFPGWRVEVASGVWHH